MAPALVSSALVAAALAGCGSSSSGGSGGGGETNVPARVFDELVASYPASMPTANVASTDDWLMVAEGGTLTFHRAGPGERQIDFERPVKRARIGTTGVRASELARDPGLDLDDGPDADDVVYVAGGRLGLWAMRVSDVPPPTDSDSASRIDDSSDGDPARQDSARYCNAVEVVSIGGTDYLVALFSAKDDNRLRVYDLEDVRAVVASGVELGAELPPIVDVPIRSNPGAGRQVQNGQEFGAYAMGLGLDALARSTDEVEIYVALAHAGVARAVLTPDHLMLPTALSVDVIWGPAYGTGTPQHAQDDTLRDFRFFDIGFDGERVEPPVRVDPPPCTDVATENGPAGQFLYVAAESAGWLRYDISDAASWGPAIPIDYHHFPPAAEPGDPDGEPLCKVEPGGIENLFADRIAFLATENTRVLVVTTERRPHAFQFNARTQGRILDSSAGRFNGVAEALLAEIDALFCNTLVYDAALLDQDGGPPEVLEVARRIQRGGSDLSLYRAPTGPDDWILDATGCGLSQSELSGSVLGATRARFTGPAPPSSKLVRDTGQFFGRFSKMVGASIVHPDVFLSSTNDSGLASDGIVALCEDVLDADFTCFPCGEGDGPDNRSAHGAIWNPGAQWLPDFQLAAPYSVMVAGQGPESGSQGHRFRVDLMLAGNPERDPCLFPEAPDLLARWDFDQVNDSLRQQAQRFLWSELDETYNAENDAEIEALFVGMTAIGEGVQVLNRTALERYCARNLPPAGSAGEDIVMYPDLDQAGDGGGVKVYVRHLLTHREYYPVITAAESDDRDRFNRKSRLLPWNGLPQLFRVNQGGSPRWILAAPAGQITFPADHPVIQTDGELYDFEGPARFSEQHPEWRPEARYLANHRHAMVQFFDVTDPLDIAEDAAGVAQPLAAKEIISPDFGSGAIFVETLQFGQGANQQTFVFVVDFAGRLLVYDWDALDGSDGQGNQDKLFARYVTQPTVTDNYLGGNVYNVMIDRQGDQVLVYLPGHPCRHSSARVPPRRAGRRAPGAADADRDRRPTALGPAARRRPRSGESGQDDGGGRPLRGRARVRLRGLRRGLARVGGVAYTQGSWRSPRGWNERFAWRWRRTRVSSARAVMCRTSPTPCTSR